MSFLGRTTETVLNKVEELVKSKADSLIMHAGTSNSANGKNVLTNVKKILEKKRKYSPETKVVFSGLIIRKDQRNIHKDEIDTNARLKNFSSPKNIDYIDNTNINEDHLGVKKLRHSKKGYSMFAQNSIKYLRSKL